ncbi:hypothetical protein [Azospirillum sp. INR13]|uniref:hypothetical protein n=1 Tax=Azospirillum sp. INR13 TaxID=2596919 RepID=UPI0019D6A8F9|nr:hypothetical protein [Azospirillum sp. INR13]
MQQVARPQQGFGIGMDHTGMDVHAGQKAAKGALAILHLYADAAQERDDGLQRFRMVHPPSPPI